MRRTHAPAAAAALALLLSAATVPPARAIDLFTGSDLNAGSADPRPNSDAAAAAFDAAVAALAGAPPGILTFESATLGALTGNSSSGLAPGITATVFNNGGDGVRLSGPGSGSTGYNTTPGGNRFVDLRGSVGASPYGITFDFTEPVQAFGFYLVGLSNTPASPMTVSFLSGGQPQTLTLAGVNNNGVQFFGFTDAGAGIGSIRIERAAGSGDFVGLDDVRFGVRSQSAAVPETGTAALLAPGLFGLFAIGRVRRRRRAAVMAAAAAEAA